MQKDEDCKIIACKGFRIKIPARYRIIKHNVYEEQQIALEEIKDDELFKELQAKSGRTEKDFIHEMLSHAKNIDDYYEIKTETLSFIIGVDITVQKPADLKEFIESQTKQLAIVDDFKIGGLSGKTSGRYDPQTDFTSIGWWAKKGNCMIRFTLQGTGKPGPETVKIVNHVIGNAEYAGE